MIQVAKAILAVSLEVFHSHEMKILLPTAFMALAGLLNAKPSPETIKLWPEGKAPLGESQFEKAGPTITVFRPEKPTGSAFVICPGGGYGQVVGGEGAPIAKWLNKHGIVGVVLNYRLPKGNPNRPLLDVQQAIRLTRSRAIDWKINPDRIGVMGFSAGGHLASMALTKFDSGHPNSKDRIERLSSRPDFGVLVYPVITMGEGTHQGSRNNLLGPAADGALIKLYSSELQVSSKTPPTFLTHAIDDRVVPDDHSEKFHQALIKQQVATEYLPLPRGGHG